MALTFAVRDYFSPNVKEQQVQASVAQPTQKFLTTRSIEDVQVSDRVSGKNPITEQAEECEPDPATWRKISFHMRKESGLSLWFDLLRPLEWIAENNIAVGNTVHIELEEMGAVGDAKVTYLGDCPPITPGVGSVVTGKFVHQADEKSNVLEIQIEGDKNPVGVTANHPYWSEDRQDFIPVGELRIGEAVKTKQGIKHVVSLRPHPGYKGSLYNLETTEHVYRVGSLGTLVHNACANELRKSLNAAGRYGDPGTVPHHLVSRFDKRAAEARDILGKYGIDLDSHFNGVFLPSSRLGSKARGVLHESVHTNDYYATITEKLRVADAKGSKAAVLQSLQRIRSTLLNGVMP
ncbi:MAG: AHH domain-containing protein [Planctomycetota bacterium]